MDLEERLKLEPSENKRWLKIVETAKKHRIAQEGAALAAIRRITYYFKTERTNEGSSC